MNGRRCPQCGLIGFPADSACRRCGATLDIPAEELGQVPPAGGVAGRVPMIFVVVSGLLLVAYLSLTLTSDPLSFEQRQIVARALRVLGESGFPSDASIFRRLVTFRATDNWWNRWVGHAQAYAATNFPFEVVTLYPDFFTRTVDDVERAVILLHETYHLRGQGEVTAHREVWLLKRHLGWTQEKYGKTRVWNNLNESTRKFAPELFQCGPDRRSDCVP